MDIANLNYIFIAKIIEWYKITNGKNMFNNDSVKSNKIHNELIKIINKDTFDINFYPNILTNICINNNIISNILPINPLGYAVYFGNYEITKNLVEKFKMNFNNKIYKLKRKKDDNKIYLEFPNINYIELAYLRGYIKIKNFFDYTNNKNNYILEMKKSSNNFGIFAQDGYSRPSLDKYLSIKLDESHLLIALFDGHGLNDYVSGYLEKYFGEYVKVRFELMENKAPELIKQMLSRDIQHIDILICSIIDKFNYSTSLGSTLSCVIITPNKILGAWVGDSPIIIFNDKGENIFVSENHTLENNKERERCENQNCTIQNNGKFGDYRIIFENIRLTLTRSIGHGNNKNIILSKPDTFIIDKTNDLIVMICSDSFTESIKEKSNDLLFKKEIIGNNIQNKDIIYEIFPVIIKNNFDMIKSSKEIVSYRTKLFNNDCDNTTLILYSFNCY